MRESFGKIEKVKSQMPDWPYCKVLFGVPMSKCAFLPHQFRVRDFVSRFELFSTQKMNGNDYSRFIVSDVKMKFIIMCSNPFQRLSHLSFTCSLFHQYMQIS